MHLRSPAGCFIIVIRYIVVPLIGGLLFFYFFFLEYVFQQIGYCIRLMSNRSAYHLLQSYFPRDSLENILGITIISHLVVKLIFIACSKILLFGTYNVSCRFELCYSLSLPSYENSNGDGFLTNQRCPRLSLTNR